VSASHSWNLLVFRDGRRVLNLRELLRTLRRLLDDLISISDFSAQSAREQLIEALLRCGELECAVADHAQSDRAAKALAQLTDRLALSLTGQLTPQLPSTLLDCIEALEVPEQLTVSFPEGFCYYALHPLDYADLLQNSRIDAPAVAVIGIRSIGTTLSAVVRAWFELRGVVAERITVRPIGHPFERTLGLSKKDQSWVRSQLERGAVFLVVDEGPGLSGSSFLAVAEALTSAGVPQDRVILLPSSEPDLSSLLAPNASTRWSRFKSLPLSPTRRIPTNARTEISWGEWRKTVFADERDWPGIWAWIERRKLLSSDASTLFRFDGHGHYGNAVRQRAQVLAESGWGPATLGAGNGFSQSPWITGERRTQADRNTVLRLAQYCAFRATFFENQCASSDSLEQMTQVNLERALGVSHSIALPVERPVVADARMMPFEWIVTGDNRLLKVDAASHGDDHFYPGPTDIAWDVAGAITEWKLGREATDLLIDEYQRISGDSIRTRLNSYLIAYCAFRLGFSLSAVRSVSDAREASRFQGDIERYQKRLAALLPAINLVETQDVRPYAAD
jgi:hypothetical protein